MEAQATPSKNFWKRRALYPVILGCLMSAAPTAISRGEDAPALTLRKQEAEMQGLLNSSPEPGLPGMMSRLRVAATPVSASLPVQLRFSSQLGGKMANSLSDEVSKFILSRHQGWPNGFEVDFSFQDRYEVKDDRSAGLPCALLLHSLITGTEIDPSFAAMGNLAADGSVQPVESAMAKIHGAKRGKCNIVAIPNGNEDKLQDLLLIDGPVPFAGIQFHGVSNFAEAEALAFKEKPEAAALAVSEMQKVQEVLTRDPARIMQMLQNQFVIARLQTILRGAPNCLSAKYLLLYATGQMPRALTLAGSVEAAESSAPELLTVIRTNTSRAYLDLKKEDMDSSLARLSPLRNKCDARVLPYLDSMIHCGTLVRDRLYRPGKTPALAFAQDNAIESAVVAARQQHIRLATNLSIREELDR